jgi:hypothetical protein
LLLGTAFVDTIILRWQSKHIRGAESVMRGPQLAAFAEREKLQRITIAELISYRQTRDKLIERSGEFPVESEIDTLTGYAFLTPFDSVYHMAFVYGRIGDGKNVLTRLHRAEPTYSAVLNRSIRRSPVSKPRAGAC